jgi:hypothetical protein
MVGFDTRTLVVASVFVALASSLVGGLVWRTRKTYPGFGRWTVGNLLAALCLLFLSLRGFAPDWISIVLANGLAIGAGVIFLQGIRLFRGLRLYWWPELIAAALTIAAIIYFKYAVDDIGARIVVISISIGGFSLACGRTLLRQIPASRRFSAAFTGIVFLLSGAVNLVRGILAIAQAPAGGLFDPYSANAFFFAATSIAVVGWSFGFILMTGERLLADARDAQAKPGAPAEADSAGLDKVVPAAEVSEQLQRIVGSDIFRRSPRMERFLSVAVEHALTGHPEKLKEYSLGRDVFNRGEDYDPRSDSIVRVEAQRLRRKLREYYESAGKHDSVIVELHPGSYVPLFRYRDSEEPAQALSKAAVRGSNG